ncbi:hypothetical protein [Rhodohalobacter barkolensis]|jgi:hypothetical protein|uniref:Uncharacterized protein n=1 Tax=Rhodohalobacter barkolensis TaxID=2053187 RepID=A0A2N0VLS0_9BACT|nr:hypothetical protein [Rhodohalobacter barkolensis]PKD45140.1 hypothetical protein CWD77_06715 [Rhodohalobacter barkolensis]
MKNWHWIILGILFLVTLVFEFTFLADYDSHWWNSIPAFYAIFGFVSCIVIIYFAKFIAKNIVNRDINYYD